MYEIETQEASPDFVRCWQAAGIHLDEQVQGGIRSWLRAHPYPPFLEHLSFRLGNQLFFVRIVDVDGLLDTPGSLGGLMRVAEGCEGHACLMPMEREAIGAGWAPAIPGWGLVDANTHAPIDPLELVTDERIEMTDWEVQDLAVQVVRSCLEGDGYRLMSWQGNPEVQPAIWFVGESGGPEWVVVKVTRNADAKAGRPDNWGDIADHCAKLSTIGYFASVAVASADESFDPLGTGSGAGPLYRGHRMSVEYTGLERGA